MSKLVLNDVSNLLDTTTSKTTINANSAATETALDNTLSRDGSSPNQMEAPLDMNSNRIINLPAPISNLEPLRVVDLLDVENVTINSIPVGGTTGQLLTKNSNTDYDVGWGDSPWNVYVPTITSAIGTPGSTTASGRYKQLGNIVFLEIKVVINAIGTAAGDIIVTLPINSSPHYYVGSSRECNLLGLGGSSVIPGEISTNTVRLTYSSPYWVNNYIVVGSIFYEI